MFLNTNLFFFFKGAEETENETEAHSLRNISTAISNNLKNCLSDILINHMFLSACR